MSAKRITALGVLTAAAMAFALPAQAEVADLGNGVCDAGEFCIYRDANRAGPVFDFGKVDSLSYTPLRWPATGGVVNDKASSVWNRTTCDVKVFSNGKLTPPAATVPPSSVKNLKDTAVGDDKASSHDACV